ncbi:MAG: NADH:flavin oxidoreductase [Clostridiales Family XIII bacterium]|jgi:2,4-dienoyl-CoA reductase-like NADH-dependent reductase (Old Yellow Enzyme family)|nr:NADH:flavin oxidoreductase [Clostridiales Family XIII bacterium]
MASISDNLSLCGRTLKNRIVFLPCVTFSFRGDGEDYFGGQHLEHYRQMAEGGAGIVYVQGTDAQGWLSETGQWTPGSKRTLEKVTAAIHENGALAMIQLSWGGDTVTDLNAMTADALAAKQQELLSAALGIGELGFDGFEFHFGHTFLLCKTLDAEANQRTDRFGGSLENRMHVLTDILPEIRSKNGAGFILSVRMGAYLPDLENGRATARALEAAGIDVLNITMSMVPPKPAPEGFPLSDMVYGGWLMKQAVTIPVIGVGGLTDRAKLDTLIEDGYADLAGVAHSILADPAFPRKVLAREPFYACAGCPECFWYTDHTKCPARVKAVREVV